MRARTIVLLLAALAAGLTAAVLVASLGPPRSVPHQGSEDADYYCYELKRAWVCAYAKSECAARLAREDPADVQKRCTPHTEVPLTP